jgi:hypothetical protein
VFTFGFIHITVLEKRTNVAVYIEVMYALLDLYVTALGSEKRKVIGKLVH